jgi:hypothetical protein
MRGGGQSAKCNDNGTGRRRVSLIITLFMNCFNSATPTLQDTTCFNTIKRGRPIFHYVIQLQRTQIPHRRLDSQYYSRHSQASATCTVCQHVSWFTSIPQSFFPVLNVARGDRSAVDFSMAFISSCEVLTAARLKSLGMINTEFASCKLHIQKINVFCLQGHAVIVVIFIISTKLVIRHVHDRVIKGIRIMIQALLAISIYISSFALNPEPN